MHSRLLTTMVMALFAAAALARTTPHLTVLSERDYSAGGSRQFLVHSNLVGRDFVVVVSAPPIFGSWVSADLKSAGSNPPSMRSTAVMALRAHLRR
jgi:hypothetical protein